MPWLNPHRDNPVALHLLIPCRLKAARWLRLIGGAPNLKDYLLTQTFSELGLPAHIVAAAEQGIRDNYLEVQIARFRRIHALHDDPQGWVEQLAALCKAEEQWLEDSSPVCGMHEHQRRYLGATR